MSHCNSLLVLPVVAVGVVEVLPVDCVVVAAVEVCVGVEVLVEVAGVVDFMAR